MNTIKSGFYVVTDLKGMIFAVMVDWRLAPAQEVSRSLRAATGEETHLHHIWATVPPTVGQNLNEVQGEVHSPLTVNDATSPELLARIARNHEGV
jgi:hypothetical protein